ncbi:aromatic ring-hydroxylating dioxygenase subunit alpha [Paenalcaligenes niemegkensis]|uniref:aromatic ring-hydroxylating oxygenase subunit alpha n=1 Tax=Paenalcaligenes niemegkensis TaxID=2895469 RepID=UPI001EE7A8C5|nr:aromatic ring-hydroxylating dioxygenase subunit alpha [Paenalcaligenes niemegkensis]MCQ9617675.1 aromatic ring-hydroxylating dioxygenase subunit alpha [Paenalcaligenes niemegkensis]
MSHFLKNKEMIKLHLERVLEPIEHSRGLSNPFYTDETAFRFERDNVLSKEWAAVSFLSDLKESGYVKPLDFMELPLVIVRDKNDQIKVFHNVCSHRGMKLVHEEGKNHGVMVCPYHAWSYNLDGELKGTPHIGGVDKHTDERFNCENNGLREIRSHVWFGMVFVNLSGNAPEFTDSIAPLTERWSEFLGPESMNAWVEADDCKHQLSVKCNWKLAVDNYCEAYHLPWVHPALNSYSRLEDHYNILFADNFAGQGSYVYNLAEVAGTSLPVLEAWPQDKLRHAEYIALFPNVLLGIQADHAFAMILEPLNATETTEHLRLFYVGEESANAPKYKQNRAEVLNSWCVVFAEDIGAVEGMQVGRNSPAYQGGAFSPELDQPTHYFHKWNARRYLGAMENA